MNEVLHRIKELMIEDLVVRSNQVDLPILRSWDITAEGAAELLQSVLLKRELENLEAKLNITKAITDRKDFKVEREDAETMAHNAFAGAFDKEDVMNWINVISVVEEQVKG